MTGLKKIIRSFLQPVDSENLLAVDASIRGGGNRVDLGKPDTLPDDCLEAAYKPLRSPNDCGSGGTGSLSVSKLLHIMHAHTF